MYTTRPSKLIRARNKDDQEAWSWLVKYYSPLIFGWALKFSRDQNRADELVQDVFVVLLQQLPKICYDPARGKFRTLLWRITYSCFAQMFRGKKLPIDHSIAVEEVAQRDENREQADLLWWAWQELRDQFSKVDQQIFELWMAGHKAKDIAARFGKTAAAIHQIIYKIRVRLRKALRDE